SITSGNLREVLAPVPRGVAVTVIEHDDAVSLVARDGVVAEGGLLADRDGQLVRHGRVAGAQRVRRVRTVMAVTVTALARGRDAGGGHDDSSRHHSEGTPHERSNEPA